MLPICLVKTTKMYYCVYFSALIFCFPMSFSFFSTLTLSRLAFLVHMISYLWTRLLGVHFCNRAGAK